MAGGGRLTSHDVMSFCGRPYPANYRSTELLCMHAFVEAVFFLSGVENSPPEQ